MRKKLYRDPKHSILGGVASGIAKYFNKDLTLIRLIWGLSTLMFRSLPELVFIPIIIYWLMWIFVPLEKIDTTENLSKLQKAIHSKPGRILAPILFVVIVAATILLYAVIIATSMSLLSWLSHILP